MGFQEEVLKLVSRIPEGKVATYKQLARVLGKPRAYRAVGNALSGNPRPNEIPCHRVVRSDGNLGGYIFGRKRKVELLDDEGIEIESGKVNLKKYQLEGSGLKNKINE